MEIEFDSNKDAENFTFDMRATANDLRTVKVYGDRALIQTDQQLPLDNEKEDLSSLETFISSILQSILLTIIREAKIRKIDLEEIEAKAKAIVKYPLRTLAVIGVSENPYIEKIEIRVYYYIDNLGKEEGEKFLSQALEYDPIFPRIRDSFDIKIDFLFQF